jgi:hypothetical protein
MAFLAVSVSLVSVAIAAAAARDLDRVGDRQSCAVAYRAEPSPTVRRDRHSPALAEKRRAAMHQTFVGPLEAEEGITPQLLAAASRAARARNANRVDRPSLVPADPMNDLALIDPASRRVSAISGGRS